MLPALFVVTPPAMAAPFIRPSIGETPTTAINPASVYAKAMPASLVRPLRPNTMVKMLNGRSKSLTNPADFRRFMVNVSNYCKI
jgi:hypothetical protein